MDEAARRHSDITVLAAAHPPEDWNKATAKGFRRSDGAEPRLRGAGRRDRSIGQNRRFDHYGVSTNLLRMPSLDGMFICLVT